jgi:hypothetical protein
MRENLDVTYGALFSQRVLLALVAKGLQRDEAYRIVQQSAQRAWDERIPLRDLLEHERLGLDLDDIFDLSHYTRYAREIVARLDDFDAYAIAISGSSAGSGSDAPRSAPTTTSAAATSSAAPTPNAVV